MDIPDLDKSSPRPLVDQLVSHYRSAIEDARLRPGDRLPTIREAAVQAGVTRSTVQDAYRRLRSLGLVDATVGRGTVVIGEGTGESALSPGAHAAFHHLLNLPQPPAVRGPVVCNFAELNPDQALFPVAEFGASLQRVLSRRGPELLGYGPPTGDPELRRILARMSRDDADPDEVLVTNGAQQGIDIVLRTFTRPGDGVAVAIPTYHHLFGLLKAHDLRVVPLRGEGGVVDPDELARVLNRDDVRLLYVMPTFHNPTGRSMNLAQRQELMEVVSQTRVPVLEDEFEVDLRFRGEPLPSLQSMDERDLTVTVRTFSKGLFPGVRLGWVHAGSEVRGPMAALKRFIDLETSPLLQAALVDFLESGALADYLSVLRDAVRKRHTAAEHALKKHMPDVFTWTEPDGGFLRWLEGPAGFDADRLVEAAAAQGVLVTSGRLFYPADHASKPVPGVRLSLSRADEHQVTEGIRILGRSAGELLTLAGPSERPLIL
jgi:DNA-binding transcriptional MocR family regulator